MKFRKKPLVIDAVQFTKEMFDTNINIPEGVICNSTKYDPEIGKITEYGFCIRTLEGDMTVSVGDWIITGIKGEKYPCKPDIFEATYELVTPNE